MKLAMVKHALYTVLMKRHLKLRTRCGLYYKEQYFFQMSTCGMEYNIVKRTGAGCTKNVAYDH